MYSSLRDEVAWRKTDFNSVVYIRIRVLRTPTPQTPLQYGFVQHGFHCILEYKCEQLSAEGEKFDYTRSAKQGIAVHDKFPKCIKFKR